MIFEINFTYLLVSICLWFYALWCLSLAIKQIEFTTTPQEINNKNKANEFLGYIFDIVFFSSMYLTGIITANNTIMLKYFVIFIVIHSIARIIYGFRKYPDNIKSYSMCEIYVNMIIYMITVGWMCYLWVL